MNEHVERDMSGAPENEQKELRSNEVHVSAILRMARAELLLIFLFFYFFHFYIAFIFIRGILEGRKTSRFSCLGY